LSSDGKNETGENIQTVDIVKEMETSFIDYAMSVIVARALPDVRDGLKPIHRRILYAMHSEGLTFDKATTKCAAIVGEVTKMYHPHGEVAIYDALVRMAQDFNLRYPLVHGKGNFGSVDGNNPAAMRYTEAKLTRIGESLLDDIAKDTVNFVPNYLGNSKEPSVLPCSLPNLLMNGSEGIAVGMATRIPPHNLRELAAGISLLIDNPDATVDDLIRLIPAPDFPTRGIIVGNEGILRAYREGHGNLRLRGRAEIEMDDRDKPRIVITEIPYQINKRSLIEKIHELYQQKRIQGISDLRDESNRLGIRIVLELKRDADPPKILNNLYRFTQLQTSISIIFLAIVDGVPRTLNLKAMLAEFLKHRRVVVRRRCQYELDRAKERAHILEGLKIALDHLDEIIALIRGSADPKEAKQGLMSKFGLSDVQAQAILDMKLQQLTKLEKKKVEAELEALYRRISELEDILANPKKIDYIVKKELAEAAAKFGDDRRTMVVTDVKDDGTFSEEDLITAEEVVVLLTRNGYVKRVPVVAYRFQMRGGKGLIGATTKAEDVVNKIVSTSTLSTLLCFTTRGIAHTVRVYKIPSQDRASKGLPIINLLNITEGERITAMIPIESFAQAYLFMATKKGVVKKCPMSEFAQLRSTGKRAVTLEEGDELSYVMPTSGSDQVMLFTRCGMAVKFNEKEVRAMGTTAHGVRGVRLKGDDDEVVGMDVVADVDEVLVVGENGLGKRSSVDLFRATHRGAQGVIALKLTEKTGQVVGAVKVKPEDQVLLGTTSGKVIRIPARQIRITGRSAQGVKLMTLGEGDSVATVDVLSAGEDADASK
jgi:DNA gyrase subunit A